MKLNYKKSGEGPPMLILHGLLGSLDNWGTLGRKLAENYTVYLVDARNHGRSPHASPFTYEAMAADVLEFITEEGLEKPVLVGHSMGGKTAMKLALEKPGIVGKLVVVDMPPRATRVNFEAIIEGLQAVDLTIIKSRGDAEGAMKFKVPELGIRQFLLKNLYRTEDKGFAWRFNLPLIAEKMDNIGEAMPDGLFEGPTCFIRGGRSDYVMDEDKEDILARFPKASIRTVEGAGHWVHAEKPQGFLEELTAFLQEA